MGQEEHATYEDALNARVAWMRRLGVARWSGVVSWVRREGGSTEYSGLIPAELTLGPAPREPTPAELAYVEAMKVKPEHLSEADRALMARRAKYKRELGYVPTDDHLARLP